MGNTFWRHVGSRTKTGFNPVEGRVPDVSATWDDEASTGLAPRLRIAHLLYWTVASALGFAAYRAITPSLGPSSPRVYLGVYNSVMGLALGTILTGVGIIAYRRWRRGMPYPSLPAGK